MNLNTNYDTTYAIDTINLVSELQQAEVGKSYKYDSATGTLSVWDTSTIGNIEDPRRDDDEYYMEFLND